MLFKLLSFLVFIFAVLVAAGIIISATKESCGVCYLYLLFPIALIALVVILRMKFEK